tara:strand:- start:161 stop:721 length:561 start_codon:yes stop_codon:yes gene_type:complete
MYNSKILISALLVVGVFIVLKRRKITIFTNSLKNKTMDFLRSQPYLKAQDPDYVEFSLNSLKGKFSRETIEKIERIYREETGHFTSGQYLKSLTPGLVISIDGKKLGWDLSKYPLVGSVDFTVGGKVYNYAAFKSLPDAMEFLGDYILRHDGNEARWFSTDVQAQNSYRSRLLKIIPRLTNKIFSL